MTVTDIARHIAAERELARELAQFEGEWVAVRGHRVVSHAQSSERLLEQLKGQHVDRYFRVATGAALL